MKTTATLDPEGTTLTMARGAWANSYPVTDLPKCIAFYQGALGLAGGKAAFVRSEINKRSFRLVLHRDAA